MRLYLHGLTAINFSHGRQLYGNSILFPFGILFHKSYFQRKDCSLQSIFYSFKTLASCRKLIFLQSFLWNFFKILESVKAKLHKPDLHFIYLFVYFFVETECLFYHKINRATLFFGSEEASMKTQAVSPVIRIETCLRGNNIRPDEN